MTAPGSGSSGYRGAGRAPGAVPLVRLYEAGDCHLCRVARSLLTALQRTVPFNIEPVDISNDDELVKRFALEVPVVEVGGEVVAQGRIDIEAVRAAVNRARIALARDAATGA
ncbi:MAG: hypothetical protein DWG80_06025 [Chloroflexi bacterium]|nr:hypothetical protein [Chloroflexota bacterium]